VKFSDIIVQHFLFPFVVENFCNIRKSVQFCQLTTFLQIAYLFSAVENAILVTKFDLKDFFNFDA